MENKRHNNIDLPIRVWRFNKEKNLVESGLVIRNTGKGWWDVDVAGEIVKAQFSTRVLSGMMDYKYSWYWGNWFLTRQMAIQSAVAKLCLKVCGVKKHIGPLKMNLDGTTLVALKNYTEELVANGCGIR